MSVRDELHQIVDQLADEPATQLLDYARGLVNECPADEDSALLRLNKRMGPGMVSGHEFFAQREPKDLKTIAAEQGVKPVERFEDLLGDFWPEDEKGENFDAWLREVRRDGEHE